MANVVNVLDIDNPLYLSFAFHPRRAKMNSSKYPDAMDGSIPIPETEFSVGYRFYPLKEDTGSPVYIHFHGNAEVVTDWEPMIVHFHRIKVAVFALDYRGYGWSTGKPLLSKVQNDAEHLTKAAILILKAKGYIHNPIFIHGRSLGSASAIHLGYKYSGKETRVKGVIVESGIYNLLELPAAKMVAQKLPGGGLIVSQLPNVFNHEEKLTKFTLPILVIHGENDEVTPATNADTIYETAASAIKFLEVFHTAGHNDILYHHGRAYFELLRKFMRRALNQTGDSDTESKSVTSKSEISSINNNEKEDDDDDGEEENSISSRGNKDQEEARSRRINENKEIKRTELETEEDENNSQSSSISSGSGHGKSTSGIDGAGVYFEECNDNIDNRSVVSVSKRSKMDIRKEYLELKAEIATLYDKKNYKELLYVVRKRLARLSIDDIDWETQEEARSRRERARRRDRGGEGGRESLLLSSTYGQGMEVDERRGVEGGEEEEEEDEDDAYYTIEDIKYDIITYRCKAYFKSNSIQSALDDCNTLLEIQPNNLNILKIRLIYNILMGNSFFSKVDAFHCFENVAEFFESRAIDRAQAARLAGAFVVLMLVFHQHK